MAHASNLSRWCNAVADSVNEPKSSWGGRPWLAVNCLQRSILDYLIDPLRKRFDQVTKGQIAIGVVVQLIAVWGLLQGIRHWKRGNLLGPSEILGQDMPPVGSDHGSTKRSIPKRSQKITFDAEATDPGLLSRNSRLKSYTISIGTYPAIRTFYKPHAQADKLPTKPTPIPLLVFIHGLGGSLAQFHPLLTSLVNVAPCLGVDLPGCGLSHFLPTSWDHYTPTALAELLSTVIEEYCDWREGQGVILVSHSMGCSLSALLASKTSPVRMKNGVEILGFVAICAKASVPSAQQVAIYKKILSIPTPIFDLWRMWDRRHGPESPSVARFAGQDADIETKRLQERFNKQSRTPVWRRMAWGALPERDANNNPIGGSPGFEVWAGLNVPLFLIAGESDSVTKASEIAVISRALGKVNKPALNINGNATYDIPQTNQNPGSNNTKEKITPRGSMTETTIVEQPVKTNGPNGDPGYSDKSWVLKTVILPAPASHALLYDPSTSRTLAGLIQTFLSERVDARLSLGWQLQHLSTEGKWDVKNLVKWQAVPPVSKPIAGIFQAMKTLREVDASHSPGRFVHDWKGKIKTVIDISHENPVYDPKALDDGGIEYHKFPTVSKIPPMAEEVRLFIGLVDKLRSKPGAPEAANGLIGVHCHYGFNRTGFFICCYLIERERFGVQQAINEFAAQRPPGIKHAHFLDTLFVRYCAGLKRTPTL